MSMGYLFQILGSVCLFPSIVIFGYSCMKLTSAPDDDKQIWFNLFFIALGGMLLSMILWNTGILFDVVDFLKEKDF